MKSDCHGEFRSYFCGALASLVLYHRTIKIGNSRETFVVLGKDSEDLTEGSSRQR